jgi:hypothetical protein
MALLLADGFDLYNDATLAGWARTGSFGSNGSSTYPVGRTGSGQSWAINHGNGGNAVSFATQLGNNYSTLIVGIAAFAGYISERIIAFNGLAGADQVGLRINSSGQLIVTRGATVLATETVASPINTWYYYELKVTFATGVGGSYALRRNGLVVTGIPDATGVNTSGDGNAFASGLGILGVQVNSNVGAYSYDDLYLCDTSGALNNNFLGDVRSLGLLPNGVGTNTNWTKVGASSTNWQSVNENPPNGDTTYVASNTIGQTDTYAYADLPSNTASVIAVTSHFDTRLDDAGARSYTTRVRSGGSEANATGSITPTLT